ncbi:hypothetical protein L249_8437 [Ophiocordyceps polyrhachis-furcata BCC 54312]|uniref:Uncharacterized protein n=1 Tax=Ophiocordyceps polyrhachis-furcata BCC 54312 TaxID=1330021 RepID=A0A367L6T2_9HYPO|nr:hypothetical protein L249_8437 [Ophiocordyceps polyrhachis-furcata BCC 54312]
MTSARKRGSRSTPALNKQLYHHSPLSCVRFVALVIQYNTIHERQLTKYPSAVATRSKVHDSIANTVSLAQTAWVRAERKEKAKGMDVASNRE